MRKERTTSARPSAWPNIVVGAIAAAGLVVGSYPTIAQWFSQLERSEVITGYVAETRAIDGEHRQRILEEAHAYNDAIPEILLTDPYTLKDASEGKGGAWELYQQQLRAPRGEVMARITIPDIDVDLPILHGTDDLTLSRGVGHLFGSSLPVGGEGTHSVLTAHTAFVDAMMFDRLTEVQVGDVFFIDVFDERLAYQVDQTQAVLPEEIDDLQLVPGEDYVTLITCTPPAVNTHRLLVRGARIPLSEADHGSDTITSGISHPGFPWWAVWVGAGLLLISGGVVWASRPELLARRVPRRVRQKRRGTPDSTPFISS
ncbi:class C sortase [Microbacterium sp.]|uniref:class C sortase n=1 Tax=Microbacterium sp. TaxID=51671 RepID=UPI0039E6AB66